MSVILNIGEADSTFRPAKALAITPSLPSAHQIPEDIFEFSGAARAMAQGVERSSLRLAQIRAIRTEIESGSFETPERIAGSVSRLLDVIV